MLHIWISIILRYPEGQKAQESDNWLSKNDIESDRNLCQIVIPDEKMSESPVYENKGPRMQIQGFLIYRSIELSLKKGFVDGQVGMYFESGGLGEIPSYKKGKMDGTWSSWNEEGVKIGEANYKDNKKHGEWFIWDDEGTLRFEMQYTNGKKTGTWRMYNEKGELVSEEQME